MQPVALGDAASGGEDQREGVVGGGAVEDAGGVGDGHAGGLGRVQVDVVESDGHVGDDLQLGPAAASSAASTRSVSVMTAALAPAMPASSSARLGGSSSPTRTVDAERLQVLHGAVGEQPGDIDQAVGHCGCPIARSDPTPGRRVFA